MKKIIIILFVISIGFSCKRIQDAKESNTVEILIDSIDDDIVHSTEWYGSGSYSPKNEKQSKE